MGKGSGAKAEITEYRMSIHLGVALRLDSVRSVLIDDKVAWSGAASDNTVLTIAQPDLFGGPRKEGGVVGAIEVLLGDDDQVASDQLAARYGVTPDDCPGFRGYTSLFFRGSGQVNSGSINAWEIFTGTEWPGNVGANGFLWRNNTPYIAQKIEVEGTCAPRSTLDPDYALIPNPDHPTRPDANPAHIIWEALVDDEFGMGTSADALDAASFELAAQTLHAEGFGLTILWMRQTEIQSIVDEVLQHVQGTLFTDPETGKLALKLHRADYDVDALPVITPSNAKLTRWQERSGGEIVNELTVSWTNPDNEQDESITGHVLASIDAQGGKSSSSRNYYAVRHEGLARTLLARDLRESTAPLASCEAALDRTKWNLKPGDVVKVEWPRRSTYARIMRVGKVNYGRPGSSTIRVSLLEDVFSLALPPIAIGPGTGWVDPSVEPSPLTMQLTTLPAYFSSNGQVQSQPIALERPEVLVMSLADSQDEDSLDYDLVTEVADAAGVERVQTRGTLTMTPLGYLGGTLSAAATSELPAGVFPDINWGPTVGGFVWLGYGDTNQEVALVTGRTETGWTLARGALDTVPRTWAAGTPVWCVNPGMKLVDEIGIQAGGAVVAYRGLDRTSKGLLAYADAPEETATLTERPHLPLRPANVKVNGVGFGSVNVSAASTIEVTWATRNRLLEDVRPLTWTEDSVQPEFRQETVVRFYDVATGDMVAEYPWIWTDTSISFPKTAFDRWASVRVVVTSRRDDLEALQAHTITLTGLAANPSTPLPPAPDTRTPPPAVSGPPAEGAFTAAAGVVVAEDGSRVPTIVVTGQPAVLERGLVARYRISGSGTWTVLPALVLNGEAVRFELPGIQAQTNYNVGVAYVRDGIPGQFRGLADVSTDTLIAGDAVAVAGVLGSEIVAQIEDLVTTYGDTVSSAENAAAAAASASNAILAEANAVIAQAAAEDAAGDAGSYAASAASSATNASTSAGNASTSATNASNSATSAAGSANTATTQATNAANSATSAGNSATAAAGSASTAATHATNAGNSATAASSSQVAAQSSAIALLPRDFQNEGDTWASAYNGLPSSIPPLVANAIFSFPTITDIGKVLRITASADYCDVAPRGAVRLVSGRRRRISCRFRLQTWASGPQLELFAVGLDAAYSYTTYTTTVYQAWTPPGSGWEAWRTVAFDVNDDDLVGGGNVFVRPMVRIRKLNPFTNVFDVEWLAIDDITESTAAAASASAAATSASNASTSATAAGSSATAAQTSATNAATSAGDASTSATNASNSETTAAGHASSASTSATNAANSATAAGGSASAAAGSASSAATSATAAGNSASAAAASQVSARLGAAQTFPSDFGRDNAYFTPSLAGLPESTVHDPIPAVWSFATVDGARVLRTNDTTNTYMHVRNRAVRPATPGKVYEQRFRVRRPAGANNTAAGAVFYGLTSDGTFTYLTGSDVTTISIAGLPSYVDDLGTSWSDLGVRYRVESTKASTLAWIICGPYTFRSAGPAGTVEWAYLEFNDVTEQFNAAGSAAAAATSASSAATSASNAGTSATAASGSATTASTAASNAGTYAGQASTSATDAAGSATAAASSASTAGTHAATASSAAATATTQASNASASAASASNSATIAASVSAGAATKNSGFDGFPTTPGLPTSWSQWWGDEVANNRVTRVDDLTGGYAVEIEGAAGQNAGIIQATEIGTAVQGQSYVLTVEAEVTVGGWTGSYFGWQTVNDGQTAAYQAGDIYPATDADDLGVASSSKTGRRTWSRFITVSSDVAAAGYRRWRLYVLAHNSGSGSIAAANKVCAYKASIRPATPQEVATQTVLPTLSATVSTQAGVLSNLQSNYAAARFQVAATTSGGQAILSLLSDTYGTVAGIKADKIYFGENTYFDDATKTLRTTSGANTRVLALGNSFGTDGTLTQWEGPSTVAFSAMSRTNAYFFIANVAPFTGGGTLAKVDLTALYGAIGRGVGTNLNMTTGVGGTGQEGSAVFENVPSTGKFIVEVTGIASSDMQAGTNNEAYGSYRVYIVKGATETEITSGAISVFANTSGGSTIPPFNLQIAHNYAGNVKFRIKTTQGGLAGTSTGQMLANLKVTYQP